MNFATTRESGDPLFKGPKSYIEHVMDFVVNSTTTQVYTEDQVDNMVAEVQRTIDNNDKKTKLALSDLKIAVKKLFKKVRHPDYYVPDAFPAKGSCDLTDYDYVPFRQPRWQMLNDLGDVVAEYDDFGSLIAKIW